MKRCLITLGLCLLAVSSALDDTTVVSADDSATQVTTASSSDFLDGKTLSGWHVDPKDSADQWTVVDGMIIGDNVNKKGSVLWTDIDYCDFELTLEFQTDSPDYDSGVFLHGESHQVQIGTSRSLNVDLTACIYAPVDNQGPYQRNLKR